MMDLTVKQIETEEELKRCWNCAIGFLGNGITNCMDMMPGAKDGRMVCSRWFMPRRMAMWFQPYWEERKIKIA